MTNSSFLYFFKAVITSSLYLVLINITILVAFISLGIKEIHSLTWGSTGNSFVQSADTWENVAAKVSPQVQSVLDKLGP